MINLFSCQKWNSTAWSWQVLTDDGVMLTCSRTIGVIYYLTRDWKEEFGGNLVDIPEGRLYVPLYNSVVAFRVPRYHEVTPVLTERPRYSVSDHVLGYMP